MADDPDGLYQAIKRARAQFIAQHVPLGADGQVRSVAGRFGVVAYAGEMSIAAGILPAPRGEAENAAVRCFNDWLHSRGSIGSGEKQMGINAVRHFLELHGSSRFQFIHPCGGDAALLHRIRQCRGEADTEAEDELETCRINNQAGYKKQDRKQGMIYLITPEVWKNEVCKGMDPDLIAKAIDEKGWLMRGEGNHLAKKHRLPNDPKQYRFFTVSERILAADEGDEEAEQESGS